MSTPRPLWVAAPSSTPSPSPFTLILTLPEVEAAKLAEMGVLREQMEERKRQEAEVRAQRGAQTKREKRAKAKAAKQQAEAEKAERRQHEAEVCRS